MQFGIGQLEEGSQLPCVNLRSLQLVPSGLVVVRPTLARGGGPVQRKTRLRWHHRMKTYTDQTRDQYMPGAPSRKARQSRSTAAGSRPAGAMACGSRRV